MFLKKEKDPTTKLFDDDEWVRSLTEAQEITADVLEECLLGPASGGPVSRRLFAGEIAAIMTAMGQLGDGPKKFSPFKWESS